MISSQRMKKGSPTQCYKKPSAEKKTMKANQNKTFSWSFFFRPRTPRQEKQIREPYKRARMPLREDCSRALEKSAF